MYIGSTDVRGLHHLVREIVDNSVDEALGGHADTIVTRIGTDGVVTVTDNGRGIPVDKHAKQNKSALEVIMTILHAGGKFGGGGYKVSGGLHGVGASVVNALSSSLWVEVYKAGKIHRQEYVRGIPSGSLKVTGKTENHGTRTSWLADSTIFSDASYDYEALAQRFREMAYLNKGVWIQFIDERIGEERNFYFEGGIQSFVRHLNRDRAVVHRTPVYVEREQGGTMVEIALQYNDGYSEAAFSFANCINTVDGGTHLTGFRSALTRILNDYARRQKFLKDDDSNLSGDDVREGLVAVISVKLPEPQFEGQTKGKLGNAEVKNHVEIVLADYLNQFLEEHPGEGRH